MKTVHVACAHCGALNRLPESRLSEHPRCGRCRESVFAARPLILSQANFSAQVARSDLPVLVDFWAAWCGPCQMMAPVLDQAARRLEPGVRVGKVDTEANSDLATHFGIRSIPTLVLLRQGQELARQAGAMPLESLLAWVGDSLD